MSVYLLVQAIKDLSKVAERVESLSNDYEFDTAEYYDDPYVKDQRDRFSAALSEIIKAKESLNSVLDNMKE